VLFPCHLFLLCVIYAGKFSLINKLVHPIPCQFILSWRSFITNNQNTFQTNSSILNTNTRNKHHLRRPNANLSFLKKSIFYAGIKIFNCLPPSVIILKNDMAKFKADLRKYLHTHCFYSVDDFLMYKDDL
jgi:hypothetical protein